MDDYDGGAEGSGPGTSSDSPEQSEWLTPDELPPSPLPDDLSPIPPGYDGPSVGPMTAEEDAEGQRSREEYEEQQRELMRELGQETPESTKPEAESEPLFETPAE